MSYLDPRVGMQYAWRRLTSGKEYFVSSVLGSSSNNGKSWGSAKATIAQALALCAAGDVIYVAEDHAETITAAAGIDLNIAGVSVIGLGRGSRKPTITMGTSTAATFKMSAANILVAGLRFVNNIDSLVKFVDIAADDANIEDCEFIGSSAKEFISGVNIGTTYDNTKIRRCRFIQPTDPAGTNAAANTGAIYLVDSENVEIEDCEFRGCFETAMVHNRTTGAANLWIRRCWGQGSTSTSDSLPFVWASGATGGVDRCSITNPNEPATTEATYTGTFPAGVFNFQSYFGNDGGGGQNAIAVTAAAS